MPHFCGHCWLDALAVALSVRELLNSALITASAAFLTASKVLQWR